MTGDPRFRALLDELWEMHVAKNADYGTDEDPLANVRASEDFGVPAWIGAMARGNDKVRRLMTYAKTGTLTNEGARDAFLDLAAYALIALVLHEEGSGAVLRKDDRGDQDAVR